MEIHRVNMVASGLAKWSSMFSYGLIMGSPPPWSNKPSVDCDGGHWCKRCYDWKPWEEGNGCRSPQFFSDKKVLSNSCGKFRWPCNPLRSKSMFQVRKVKGVQSLWNFKIFDQWPRSKQHDVGCGCGEVHMPLHRYLEDQYPSFRVILNLLKLAYLDQ